MIPFSKNVLKLKHKDGISIFQLASQSQAVFDLRWNTDTFLQIINMKYALLNLILQKILLKAFIIISIMDNHQQFITNTYRIIITVNKVVGCRFYF